jgi:hypothetical protein
MGSGHIKWCPWFPKLGAWRGTNDLTPEKATAPKPPEKEKQNQGIAALAEKMMTNITVCVNGPASLGGETRNPVSWTADSRQISGSSYINVPSYFLYK